MIIRFLPLCQRNFVAVTVGNLVLWETNSNRTVLCGILDLCRLILGIVVDLFRPCAAMEAEILVLRQQIIVLRRGRPSRVQFLAVDRMVLGWVCHLFPKTREALAIVRPGTVVRWHRAGFRRYWRWKSRPRWGRPGVPAAIRRLIREMSVANPLWGAPRIHGEPVKLGIDRGHSPTRLTNIARFCASKRRPNCIHGSSGAGAGSDRRASGERVAILVLVEADQPLPRRIAEMLRDF